jgi:hypothetical protein
MTHLWRNYAAESTSPYSTVLRPSLRGLRSFSNLVYTVNSFDDDDDDDDDDEDDDDVLQ